MEDFQKDIVHIKQKINQLYVALVGDDISKDGGLVERINELEKLVEIVEKRSIRTAMYVKWLWGTGGAVIMAAYSLFIKK